MDNKEISTRHEVFLEAVLAGNPLDVAGRKAGFSTPERDAYPILTHPEVRKRFTKIVQGKAMTEGMVICYNYFIELVRDKTKPDKTRLDAAKFLYAHHMPAAKAQDQGNTDTKDVSEMNNAELHDFVVTMEAELKSRLKDTQGIDDMI